MTFREFMQLDELEGHYGDVKANVGPLGLINQMIKLAKPVKGKGSSVSRMFNAGKVASPARPPKITSVKGPMTSPSVLK